MIPPRVAKILLTGVEPDTAEQIRANLPAAYVILAGDCDAAAGGETCRCAGEPLDIPQLKECARRALAGAAALPGDVESLIRSTVEELVEEGMPLDSALQRFTARFSDRFPTRELK